MTHLEGEERRGDCQGSDWREGSALVGKGELCEELLALIVAGGELLHVDEVI